MELRHEMAVAIECGLNRGMSQLRLNVLRVGAVGDQETRIGMAEMETHPAEARTPERLRELRVAEVVVIPFGRRSLWGDRDPRTGATRSGKQHVPYRAESDAAG